LIAQMRNTGETNVKKHSWRWVILIVTVAAVFGSGSIAEAQGKDSADARRRATRAQATFEMIRRRNLPLGSSGPASNTCDARIGRFCQWNSTDDTVEAKLPRQISRARATVIASLDSAALKAPRDGWITGQRIRYLLEARNDTAAVRVARQCQATEWWCAALLGLALHESAAGAVADSAFARALRTMPAKEGCRWTDLTPILEPELRKQFGKVGCGKNESTAERLWWLADPFWSIDGNDRRTEHYARHTMAKILEPARNAYNLSWSNDLSEMIVRYGWARYWTRGPGSGLEPDNGPVSGHEPTPNYHFVPTSASLDSIAGVSFDLDRTASAERYAPLLARRVIEINPQVAVFRRGDSALVVAAYDVTRVSQFDSADVSAALVLAADERGVARAATSMGRRGALAVTVRPEPQLMSLEIVSSGTGQVAAWRRKVLPLVPTRADSLSMSDPLLFDVTEADVMTLDDAMRSARDGNPVDRGKVGIYWEIYGLSRRDSAQPVSLSLTPTGQGVLRRFAESIGIASKTSPLVIRWNQSPSGESITSRSVILDLELIPRGKYLLTIGTGDQASVREIEIRE
ncbi:MAG: hypothetical protein ABIS03_11415, partial [Gemmatimonadaceae bacterium]